MITFLIACSGQAQRWDNYMGVAKHLIKINGERILDRTIRLIRERVKEDCVINVIAFDEKYKANGSILQIPQYETQTEKDEHFVNPFLYVSKRWWNDTGPTIILFGDVYFTEEAINTIINSVYNLDTYTFYGRPGASAYTGCKYGEIFGVSFTRDYSDNLWNTICEVKKLRDENKIKRFISWEVYRMLQSIDLNTHEIKNNFTIIDDFTDDFDYPRDYDLWIERWNKYNLK
jgi:choline kinase